MTKTGTTVEDRAGHISGEESRISPPERLNFEMSIRRDGRGVLSQQLNVGIQSSKENGPGGMDLFGSFSVV